METDEEEFSTFVDGTGRELQRFAWRLTQDWGLAEDAVQSALIKLWTKWDSVYPQSRAAYAKKAIVSSYISWRRLRSNTELVIDTTDHSRFSPDETDSVDERLDLTRRLERLSRRQRTVLVLRYLEDLSEADTARLMSCSIGSVKRQTSRAIFTLRKGARAPEESHEPYRR